jgi:streptogramin lyase
MGVALRRVRVCLLCCAALLAAAVTALGGQVRAEKSHPSPAGNTVRSDAQAQDLSKGLAVGTHSQENSPLAGQLVVPAVNGLLAGEQTYYARVVRRSTPQAVAMRAASRSRFQSLTPTAVAREASRIFPDLLNHPAQALSLRPREKILRYPTDNSAQISRPGTVGIVESLAPIAKSVAGGRHEALDLHLREAGGQFAPVRSGVDVEIPKLLSQGVSLPALGVALTPVDAHGSALRSSAPVLGAYTVLWGSRAAGSDNTADMSTVAKPLPNGVDLSTLLLSERSPRKLYFRVGIPRSARLTADHDGSAQVVVGRSTLATVPTPSAHDAEGSDVPVSMSVHGDVLELAVHPVEEPLYPIAVDPEVNDGQLATTSTGKRSNWEFHTSNSGRFAGAAVYEGPGKERLETTGIGEYAPTEWAYWGYQTQGNSKIYELKAETTARNRNAKIESFLEFQEPGGARETKKLLSTEVEGTIEYTNQVNVLCAANAAKQEECLPSAGKGHNAVHFQQSATAYPGANYHFSDTMTQGIVSISEPFGTHSTTSFNTTSPILEFEVESEGKKEKVSRANALYGSGSWVSKFGGAFEPIAKDPGVGVAATRLEYESAVGKWTQLQEHKYLENENACRGVQCYETHAEHLTLPEGLVDGQDKIRYRAEEAIAGTQSLESEGTATLKVDSSAPHRVQIHGLPYGNELSERPYELTAEATDGEGTTTPSSGVKEIALYLDGVEFGEAGGSCSTPKGECTASTKWTVNGAELGAGRHDIAIVAKDQAGNEARLYRPITIRHSTPVALGPGSVDLESGDFSLGAADVSFGSGLTVSRAYSSRATEQGIEGPLGPQWTLGITSTESLTELVDGGVLMTSTNGSQTIFAALGEGKFESPPGDSNLNLRLEENKATKVKEAYYLENAAAHTKVKFTLPLGGTTEWVPTVAEGTTGTDTVTYKYKTAEGQDEYPASKTEGSPSSLATGPDGNLWFTYSNKGTIGRMTTNGGLTEFSVPGATRGTGITAGPDGNVWFADNEPTTEWDRIGKITPKGTITQYLVTKQTELAHLTPGPEHESAIWFTNRLYRKIGKITTAGQVTEYSLPTGRIPTDIVAGPGGIIWFTDAEEGNVQRIGQMTTSGVITAEYALPTHHGPCYPSPGTRLFDGSITVGPEGNLWFTRWEGCYPEKGEQWTLSLVGKMTPAGTVTDYELAGSSHPVEIAEGPDRNLWFTNSGTNNIDKITAAGAINEYHVPSSGLGGIVTGPDRNVWFTEASARKIGMLPPSGTITEPVELRAPVPSGVSCSWTEKPTEMQPGCRALEFKYATKTSATGEAESQWGEYNRRLIKVSLVAYDPASKTTKETAVAEYRYDQVGRLRAEWDPRIATSSDCSMACSALKTRYGYDPEGHITALSPPGQEPWLFSYGSTSGDLGTGRLLKARRVAASEALWSGGVVTNTASPTISGSPMFGVRMTVSNGSWSGVPLGYAYQWERCDSSGLSCAPIADAQNQNYTPTSADLGHTLTATVTATNAGGSASATAKTTGLAARPGVTEYALPAGSSPAGVATGPDSNVWFGERYRERIAKITPSGGITEYKITTEKLDPSAITLGPDGNMWFPDWKEGSTSKIGKITVAGTVSEFGLPLDSHPEGIAAGRDGNLWFTEYKTNRIGKITPSGAISETTLPTGSQPLYIAAGPDGNLWFTEPGTNKIGKISTAAQVTEFALPAGSGPIGIAVGPDGNVWFTERASSKIGKITSGGVISEYALPAGSSPSGITAGPNSTLWFTAEATGKIGKLTTAGVVVSETALATGSKPTFITTGGDGNLWFTEPGANKVGELNPNTLSEGEAKPPQPGITLEYGVPLSGTGLPSMTAAEVAKWGQSDVPVEATSITAADEPQGWPASSYKRATIHYLDEQGREVNMASPSSSTHGSISTTEYNEFNDVIRTLTPDNRATALDAGANSVEESKLLDTQSTYNGEGKKESEVEEAGTRLIDVLGPQHMVKYHVGGETKESLARNHEVLVYNQGAPSGENYDLVTERYDLAQLANHEEVEVRTTKTSYSGQSNLGWKLRAPTSATVDPEGLNLTTTTEYDASTGQITEVRGAGADKTLSYAAKFGEAGSEPGKLKAPWGVAVNSEGKLWVVDTTNNRVEQFSSSGSYLASFGEAGSGNGQFNAPAGIALDAAGHIWIADKGNNRIQEFSSTGVFMTSVGSLGTESGKFKAPTALAFDSKGNMWVADTGNSRVEEFDKEAKYASEFGSPGSEPGKLKEPKGIAVDSGEHVWVADTANNRIQEFSTSGSLLKRFGTPGAGEGQLNAPFDLKIDTEGDIWTVDRLNNRLESFTAKGAYIAQIGFTGTAAGQLKEPRSLTFDATGKVWVSDSLNNRLEQWSKGPSAHGQKTIYYSAAVNGEYPACGSHPEWAGLVCETLPAKQPELLGLPNLPVTVTTYNMFNEPETITETFGATTRTKTEAYDAAGRRASSEVTASSGLSLPKVNFTYNSTLGALEKQTTDAEEKTLSSEFNSLGQTVEYTDADGNVAKYKYAGPEGDMLLEEASDSSASGTSRQTYEYDSTTKLRTKLIDSAAGSFTASYDAEGRMTSVSYPYSMCADYSYNSVGEATNLSYLKSSNCSETEAGTYYANSRLSSVHGEMLGQSSTLASESYVYDATGRLSETQEAPVGEGCTVRAYAYDESGNRASSTSRTPGVGGACQSEGGTIEGHNYDEAGRLADGGMAYDGLGNVTKLPAADSEGKELTSTFYVDNAVASQSQGGVTNEYKLDPEGRVRETTTGAVSTKSHYDGPGEAVAWTENAEQWVRSIPGIDGTLLATQTNGATPVIQLHDLQGNVVGTIGDKAGETKLLSSYNSTEFGVPNAGKAPPRFAWLGASAIENSFTTGVITYGSTSYVPQTGRALQSEAVEPPGLPGGSGAGAAYTMQEEPWNMQGAARAGAEAPGLEAAREQAAMEAALLASDPPTYVTMHRMRARQLGKELDEIGTIGEALNIFLDVPETLVDFIVNTLVSHFENIDRALGWFHNAGQKLMKCGHNKSVFLRVCKFEYDEFKYSAFGLTLEFPNPWGMWPVVEECYPIGPDVDCVHTVHVPSVLE